MGIKIKDSRSVSMMKLQLSHQVTTLAHKPKVQWRLKAPITPDTTSQLSAFLCFPVCSCCQPEGSKSKPDTFFLFSFSSHVNRKQISPLSCDHEPGLYNFLHGARVGWQWLVSCRAPLLTPPCVCQIRSSILLLTRFFSLLAQLGGLVQTAANH